MSTYADKFPKKRGKIPANDYSDQQTGTDTANVYVDNRAVAMMQRKLQEMVNNSPQAQQAVQLKALSSSITQRKEHLEDEEKLLQGKFSIPRNTGQLQAELQSQHNRTGMPDELKTGIELLSDMDMSSVRVHYNSPKPAQLDALAYAQGDDIHLGTGQQQHLPHEAWHVVQQRQGRVKPTSHLGGMAINDDAGLEKEADVMGERALQRRAVELLQLRSIATQIYCPVVTQRMPAKDADFIKSLYPTYYSVDDGTRLPDYAVKLKSLYGSLGAGKAGGYLNQKIDTSEFDTFKGGNEDYRVKPQKKPNTDERPGLEKGNYFHIHNLNKDKPLEQKGTARRIIVNVKTQQDAFALSKGLLDLFDKSSSYSPYIKEFKVYLSNVRTAKVKKDKIVVYYNFNVKDESADTVGDAIVARIESIADENVLVDDFAPFYEGVSKGIAWAEEPKHHSVLKGSFTRTRVDVIESVIKGKASVASADALVGLVDVAFKAAGIDVDNPARHTPVK